MGRQLVITLLLAGGFYILLESVVYLIESVLRSAFYK